MKAILNSETNAVYNGDNLPNDKSLNSSLRQSSRIPACPKAVSLTELLTVVIILGVLTTVTLTHYTASKEATWDNEAQTNLVALVSAERDYYRDESSFLISDDEATLNTNLPGILLPTAADMKWDYATTARAGTLVSCAQAERTDAGKRTWRYCSNDREPLRGTCGGGAANCP